MVGLAAVGLAVGLRLRAAVDEPGKKDEPRPASGKKPTPDGEAILGMAGSFTKAFDFTWTATVNGKTRSFSGQYTAGGGLLALVSDNGPAIVGRITVVDGGFHFKLIGSGPGDPGLTFTRS